MKRQRLIASMFLAASFSLTLVSCDGDDNKPDENLCRADCGRDLSICVRACGPNDQTCLTQCLEDFDMCRNDCHDQGGGQ